MNIQMMLAHIDADARAVAEDYVDRVRVVLVMQDPVVAQGTIEDLAERFAVELDGASSVEDARRVIEKLGEPESFAEPGSAAPQRSFGMGTVLGMPYDMRVPTPQRIASRWWDPTNPRVFVPRVFGLGWDLNFGALAVRLHLVEPDAEDEPFAHASSRAFATALGLPILLTAYIVVSYYASGASTAPRLPAHWGLSGRADEYWSASRAVLMVLALSALPTLWAGWSVLARKSALTRGAVLGFASFMAALAASVWTLTLYTYGGGVEAWWIPPALILGSLLVPLAVLVALARNGSAHERRSQLADSPAGRTAESTGVKDGLS